MLAITLITDNARTTNKIVDNGESPVEGDSLEAVGAGVVVSFVLSVVGVSV